jgi:hypothetical protein
MSSSKDQKRVFLANVIANVTLVSASDEPVKPWDSLEHTHCTTSIRKNEYCIYG